ncbi:MAG TPA: amidophosphoribosyltransferase [Acidobacteriota bacterium]|nr:amidophosphoribosyltransferase [Acidobacteriota bacterium]
MCGVFGITGHREASRIAYLGLYALQHRGQESVGIASVDGGAMFVERGMGHVADVLDEASLDRLPGRGAIGHVRYSTSGASKLQNAQPIRIGSRHGAIAVGHNGNLVNADLLRGALEDSGAIFTSTSDTEVILHLFARSEQEDVETALVDALSRVEGAYSLTALTPSLLIGARDPLGVRPLSIGHLEGALVLASETTAFDLIGGEYLRDLAPGEVVALSQEVRAEGELLDIIAAGPGGAAPGYVSRAPWPAVAGAKHCIFEHVYFARPDGVLNGESVMRARKQMGRFLGAQAPVDADVVVPVPDGGVYAAQGYSEVTGIPLELALIRNHYVGRTFIEPRQSIRHFGVKVKLNPVREMIADKRVVLVDDSIVRGTTSGKIVEMMRNSGAREVHFRVSSPPYVSPCFYGIDTPHKQELIAANHSLDEVRRRIDADSLAYLSLDGLRESVTDGGRKYCVACFTGEYPTPLSAEVASQLERFDPVGNGPAVPAAAGGTGSP